MIPTALAVHAALVTPLWIRSGRWQDLLVAAHGANRPGRGAPQRVGGVNRVSARTLAVLARLPGSPWRSTCLFRSIAACLALRRSGHDAVLRLGASAARGDVRAHAWVEDSSGRVLSGEADGWQPLAQPAR